MKEVVDIDAIHEVFETVYRKRNYDNDAKHTWAQRQKNAKTNVQPVNIGIADYVREKNNAKCEHKLQSKWRASMQGKEAKPYLVFVIEDLLFTKQQTTHTLRNLLCFTARESCTASKKLKVQAEHYDATCHLIHEITIIHRNQQELQVHIK